VFILFINAGIVASVKSVAFNVLWSSGSAICLGIWIVLAANGRIPTRVWLYGMVLVACTELIVVDSKAIQAHPFVPAQIESIQAARYLAEQQGVFRVYSPSYSLPQNVAAEYGIELADGVDPLQLNSYVHFFASASGVRDSGYSVTLPAFANANPSLDNAAAVPDAQILGRLNVKYVVAGFDITSADLALLVRFGETRIYENLDWMPRAWIEADNGSISRSAKVTFWSPDTIKVETRERGRLVLSEIDYPGWNVTVDGKPSQVVTTDGILRGVDLPDGNLHEVQFQFIPGVFYAGAAISAAVWILLIVLFLFRNHISR
jgi:hypothetical protein